MEKISIRVSIANTNPSADIGVRVRLDGKAYYETPHVKEDISCECEVDDTDGEHVLEIELFGKRAEHTTINSAGEIIKDAMLSVTSIAIDDIDMTNIVIAKGVYTHDFNGTQPAIDDSFYGYLGCNGTLKVNFTTPVYLWLLENM